MISVAGPHPVGGQPHTSAAGTGRVVSTLRAQRNHRTYAMLPMDADLLFRHQSRTISGIDDALTEVGKVYAKLHSRRERLSWPVRKALMREQTAEKKIEDYVVASVSVREDRKIHPCRIVRYDGLAKLLRVRPTVLVVERKRGKHVNPLFKRLSVASVRKVSHA